MNRPVIQLSGGWPISSIALVDPPAPSVKPPAAATASSETENRRLLQAAKALEQAAEEIREFGRQMLTSHREQLIQLSIEIAARILAKDIQQRNYEIEKIVNQALEEIPQGRPVTVKLNPEDLKAYQQVLSQMEGRKPTHIHPVADGTIGPGQCVLETEQGVIEWMIEELLKRISDALFSEGLNA
ncbi:MAG TPA: FliH/SctL family protein [Anaerohalosphaeraceae bacterium]|jgi:flagellar biosynthesis/type III secretory pathway protein FliH|nr:FliH/SctL family protein [Anaerohalosphaeraceae bacterium]